MQIHIFKSPLEYASIHTKMEEAVADVINGKEEQAWFLEHEAVYTAGTSANPVDLKESRFPIHNVGRGGKYTYHGPGQRVVYLMLDLKKHYPTPDLRRFVWDLEQWVIDSLAEVGIEAFRREGRIGIWVADKNSLGGESKIAAIGIRVRKWVSFHGISINIAPDLSHFSGIVPCGIEEFGVTSLKALGINKTMREFDEILVKNLKYLKKSI